MLHRRMCEYGEEAAVNHVLAVPAVVLLIADVSQGPNVDVVSSYHLAKYARASQVFEGVGPRSCSRKLDPYFIKPTARYLGIDLICSKDRPDRSGIQT
jgi:hypothetical protein